MMRLALIAAALCFATPGLAEVVQPTNDTNFTLETVRTTRATPDQAWQRLNTPGRWWSSEHSWSGDAANMRITARDAGGCWCESLPAGGSVEHGHILAWEAARRRILFRAELGPLQDMAVTGKLEWQVEAQADGQARIRFRYRVAGAALATIPGLAGMVDGVLTQQLDRLVESLNSAPE